MTVDPDSIPGVMTRAASTTTDQSRPDPFSAPGMAVALPAPTNSDDEWADWQVGSFTVATGTPVCLYVEIEEGMPHEITVSDPIGLASALLAAHRGEWKGADVRAVEAPDALLPIYADRQWVQDRIAAIQLAWARREANVPVTAKVIAPAATEETP